MTLSQIIQKRSKNPYHCTYNKRNILMTMTCLFKRSQIRCPFNNKGICCVIVFIHKKIAVKPLRIFAVYYLKNLGFCM